MPPQPPPSPWGQRGSVSSQTIRARAHKEWRKTMGLSKDEGRRKAIEAITINEALRYMDPTTRGQYMRRMSRDYPGLVGVGAGTDVPTPPTGEAGRQYTEQMLTPQRLGVAIRGLAPGTISQIARGKPTFGKDFGSPTKYLHDYLRTAQEAYGTGVERQTRAQRSFAEKRLRELGEQAEQGPGLAAMAQLGQAIINPALGRAPTSGGLGTYRSTATPQVKPQRAGMFRAGELT